jgi:hypothetical protein
MKRIDFTQPGGFPLTQDQLDYLQTAFSEVMPNLLGYRGAGTNVAVRLAGMTTTFSLGSTTVSPGWFLYNNALIRFGGGSFGVIAALHALYIQIATNGSPLTFNDGSTPTVIYDQVATLVQLPNTTPESSSLFLLSNLQDFCRESQWTVVSFSSYITGLGVSGTIRYKKDYLANTVQITGSLIAPGSIFLSGTVGYIDNVGAGSLMCTLPIGYRPSSRGSFTVDIGDGTFNCWQVQTNPLGGFSASGPMAINNFIGTVETNGNLFIKFLNGGDPATHTFSFAHTFSLD